jgi:hypothetical protein
MVELHLGEIYIFSKCHKVSLPDDLLSELPNSNLTGETDYADVIEESTTSLLKVTKEELDKLKQDSVACINDSLFKKLQEIEQVSVED